MVKELKYDFFNLVSTFQLLNCTKQNFEAVRIGSPFLCLSDSKIKKSCFLKHNTLIIVNYSIQEPNDVIDEYLTLLEI